MDPDARDPEPPSDAALVAGRYRIERELARGGMGTVYAVRDESTGQRVALKRLGTARRVGTTRRQGKGASRHSALTFQIEYATLARLRHPSIVEVYEYGVDSGVPYYTMELLDGRDLRELACVPYREACHHVRDVASCLALLHAHRLVHRDVSPRNVRVTAAGRSKLFDFGTLTPFGAAPDIAGTPACVPPEALRGGVLDHRTDLYSLGAVLYFLLTGQDAVPATCLDDLPRLLENIPAPPSSFIEEIPKELDLLVLSLLSRDPLARPTSAAEVIERLDAIAAPPKEQRIEIARAYVTSAKLVGRTLENGAVEACIERSIAGDGNAISIEGRPGFGKTRLAREGVIHAQIRGATAVFVSASLYPERAALMRAIGALLFRLLPTHALECAAPRLRILSEVVPELDSRLAEDPHSLSDCAVRAEHERAFLAWVLELSDRRALVLVVDDLDAVEDDARELVRSLARFAVGRKLAVITTACPAPAELSGRAAFVTTVPLSSLDAEATCDLAQSLFGRDRAARRFGQRLFARSHGSPGASMERVLHLVKKGVVRYADGAWTLPNDDEVDALPVAMQEAALARLDALRPEARALAKSVSVAGNGLPLSLCVLLSERDAGARGALVGSLVDELATSGILVRSHGRYRFADESLRLALSSAIPGERRRALHRELGRAWPLATGASVRDVIDAGFHLLSGGEETRGAELIANAARRLDVETDDVRAAVPALEAALAVYRAQGRSAAELTLLLGPLASASFLVDFRLAQRHGEETLDVFRSATGLARATALAPFVGERASLGISVVGAAIGRRLSPRGATIGTRELFESFLRTAVTLTGVAAVGNDVEGIRRVTDALAPLSSLGEEQGASWIYRYCSSLLHLAEGRFGKSRTALLRILDKLEEPGQTVFPEPARKQFLGGALYALGTIESLRDGAEVLRYAERLDALGLRLYDVVAEQLRVLYHAHRGESELARHFTERVEAQSTLRGSAWQVDVWETTVMLLVHVRESNVMGLKRNAERLEHIAKDIPSLDRYAMIAKGAYFRVRGDLEPSRSLLRAVVSRGKIAPFAGQMPAVGLLADVENALGNHREAERITREAIGSVEGEEAGFARVILPARIQHAVALAGLGNAVDAARELDVALEEHGQGRGPATLGMLHRARARVALGAGDLAAFEHHRAAMEQWLKPTGNPALIALCERLGHEGRRERAITESRTSGARARSINPSRRPFGE